MSIFPYKIVPQGKAIIRSGLGGTKVALEKGILVLPFFHSIEFMDLTTREMEVKMGPEDGLKSITGEAYIGKFQFFLRVQRSLSSVDTVAKGVGCDRVNDIAALSRFFLTPLKEILRRKGAELDLSSAIENHKEFSPKVVEIINMDINGFIFDEMVIEYIRPLK